MSNEENDRKLINVLRSSLYPGAKDESIGLVVAYCKAAGLDVMQKPVHIVPMWDKASNAMRDVVMPGIGLYRTQADRSGIYAGIDDPEFGEDVQTTLGGQQIIFPKWCKVTVYKLVGGQRVAYSAKELWMENYATAKKDSVAPNAMWLRRPYAQLAKCAEAQALRKAFPELGSAPTAEEMEGKPWVDVTPPKKVADYSEEDRDAAIAELERLAAEGDVHAWRKYWGLTLTEQDRAMVGKEARDRIMTLCQNAHAAQMNPPRAEVSENG